MIPPNSPKRHTQVAPLSRRTFLRGAGVSMALPLLGGMQPAFGATAAASGGSPASPVRLAWVFFPNGSNYKRWKPEGEGRDWKPSPTLEPLAHLRDDLLVLSGLAQVNARSLGDGAGDHARSSAAFLTGAHPAKTYGAGIRNGKSADQVAAEAIGHHTRLASLELGIESGRSSGDCDSGYSCIYSNNISWRSPNQPAAKEINPRLAFERLFGGLRGDRAAAQQRLAEQQSILDIVADQSRSLQKRLGGEDRRKLDEYFQSVREIEHRIDHQTRLQQAADAESGSNPYDHFQPPPAEPADLTEHIRLMYDLMVMAFRTDTTRIATLMLGNEGSNRRFPAIGVGDGHHQLSHHRHDQAKIAKIAKIDRYLAEQFAYFVEQLKAADDGEGSLLDNCAVVYGGAISDGNRHDHHNLPILMAGKAGGAVSPGRHIRTAGETPLCNLFLSMLDAAGAPVERFGDSTGRLSQLTT